MRALTVVLAMPALLLAAEATPADLPTIESCVERCAPHFLSVCADAAAEFPERTVVPCPPALAGGFCFTGDQPAQTRRALRHFSRCVRRLLDNCLADFSVPGFAPVCP